MCNNGADGVEVIRRILPEQREEVEKGVDEFGAAELRDDPLEPRQAGREGEKGGGGATNGALARGAWCARPLRLTALNRGA